jgi:hypothetical protein
MDHEARMQQAELGKALCGELKGFVCVALLFIIITCIR